MPAVLSETWKRSLCDLSLGLKCVSCNACHQVVCAVGHVTCMLVITLERFSPVLTTFTFFSGIWTGWESPSTRWH